MDRDFNRDGKIDWYDKLIEQELLYDDDEDEDDEYENCVPILGNLEQLEDIIIEKLLESMQAELNRIQKIAEQKQMDCEKMQAGSEEMSEAAERQLMNIKKLKLVTKEMRKMAACRLKPMKASGEFDEPGERWDYLLKAQTELIEEVKANDVSDAG